MSLHLATHGYISGSSSGAQFIAGLHPDMSTLNLEPEVSQVHTQGDPTNPNAPSTVMETIADLKPIILTKPRA